MATFYLAVYLCSYMVFLFVSISNSMLILGFIDLLPKHPEIGGEKERGWREITKRA